MIAFPSSKTFQLIVIGKSTAAIVPDTKDPRRFRDGDLLRGAPRGTRTPNLLIRSQMLYPLS
jgi:hypothetical protein